ncbi:MAG: divalent-cation tolerance protein CutA [Neomegalonema sp.]|nr:divalent-cation tolerance protein CutA [Neomegalonema sp.]
MQTRSATEFCVVVSTAGDLTEAHRIADALVEAKLAACVQITQISSVYRWRDRVETSGEVRLAIKSRSALFDQIAAMIKEHHSYDTPQILMLDCAAGTAEFLDWIEESTTPATG